MICISQSNDPRQHVADLNALELLIAGNAGSEPEMPIIELSQKVAEHIAEMMARDPGCTEFLRVRSGQTCAEIATEIALDASVENWLIDRELWADDQHRFQWKPHLLQDDRHAILLGRPALKAARMPLCNPVSPIKSKWRNQSRLLRKPRPELRWRRPDHALRRMYRALARRVRDDRRAAIDLAMLQFLSLRQVCPDWYALHLEQMPRFTPPEAA